MGSTAAEQEELTVLVTGFGVRLGSLLVASSLLGAWELCARHLNELG